MHETTTHETNVTQEKSTGAALKDKITAPEAAPARKRTGAGAALAVGAAGVWAFRKYRSGLAARRRKVAARQHFKVIGRETGAVMKLAAEAFGDRAKQSAGAAKKQAGSSATAARKQAAAQAAKARAKAARR